MGKAIRGRLKFREPKQGKTHSGGSPLPAGRSRQKPRRIVADSNCDSDPLGERFKKRGIELIALTGTTTSKAWRVLCDLQSRHPDER
jgi:hypothetical protein